MKPEVKIYTKQLNSGHYKIDVFKSLTDKNQTAVMSIGSFETTDMQILDDIKEMNNDGFESNLIWFDTFKEIENYVLKQIQNESINH